MPERPSSAARGDWPAAERHKAAMLAVAKITTEAAKREKAMWMRFVQQVNDLTRSCKR